MSIVLLAFGIVLLAFKRDVYPGFHWKPCPRAGENGTPHQIIHAWWSFAGLGICCDALASMHRFAVWPDVAEYPRAERCR